MDTYEPYLAGVRVRKLVLHVSAYPLQESSNAGGHVIPVIKAREGLGVRLAFGISFCLRLHEEAAPGAAT